MQMGSRRWHLLLWKLHLKAASWIDTVVLSLGDLSLVPECDRVSSPVLSQQLSNQPFRLLLSVLADTRSSRCREVIRDFTRPRYWTPQFREDAGGFWYAILIECMKCSDGVWLTLNLHKAFLTHITFGMIIFAWQFGFSQTTIITNMFFCTWRTRSVDLCSSSRAFSYNAVFTHLSFFKNVLLLWLGHCTCHYFWVF